nr:MAG TPA: hypothetical protein [Caudoviricetes sp.]DAX25689.1 MAG TPA: hypothetical protein [Caudoviricetes sp.]
MLSILYVKANYLSNVKTAPAPTGAATYPKICYYFGR